MRTPKGANDEGKKKGNIRPGYFPGVAGAFVRVTMHNFMCHRHVEVELGPRINYITGENGSGKSAILTALSVALGAKMKSVGRSSTKSSKGMIRSGAASGKITVVMSNDGGDAFRPETYGKSIVVEKTLNLTGANALKIKSEHGEVVATKADELNKLADHFCIDVDNPITIMTQDMAKAFLHSGDDKKKYAFFVKATLLQQIQEKQTISRNVVNEMKDVLNTHIENKPKIEDNIKELEYELNAFERVQELRNKSKEYRYRLAWSHVAQEENKANKEKEELEGFLRKQQVLVERLGAERRAAEQTERAREVLKTREEEIGGRLSELRAQREQVNAAYRELGRQTQMAETNKITEDTAVKKLKKKVEDTESKIQRFLDAQRGESTEVDRRIQAMNEKLIRTRDELTQCTNAVAQLDQEMNSAKEAAERHSRAARAIDSEIDNMRRQISTLKQTSTNKLILYGSQMPKLVDCVNLRKSEFSKPPIGPLGMHVSLKDQSWLAPAEEAMSGLLNAFMVATSEDMDKLRKMSKECGLPHLSIHKVNYNRGRYSIPADKVPDPKRFQTISSILDCHHDAIFNLLVDSSQIERTVLLQNEREALDMFHAKEAQKCNIGSVYTKERKIFANGPTIRNEAFKTSNQAHRLAADPRAQIKSLEEAIKLRQEKSKYAKSEVVNAQKEAKELERQKKEKMADHAQLDKKVQASKIELDKARIDADDSNASVVDVSTLQEELDTMSAELASRQQALDEAQAVFVERKKQLDKAKDEVQEKVALAENYKKEVAELSKEICEVEAENQATQRRITGFEQKQSEATLLIASAEDRIRTHTHKAVELAEDAKAICDREVAEMNGPITESPENLERLYERAKIRVTEEEKRHKRPFEEVNDELSGEQRKLMKLEAGLDSSKVMCKKLKSGVAKRRDQMTQMATDIASNVSHRFNLHMTKKGQSGRILVDYKDQRLTLQVKEGSTTKTITDTRSLSGGERSYSTLALNLALGDESDSPFRAMDEFDVFMDAVNRKVSIDALLAFARSDFHNDKQFLFITPQDISAVDANATDVKIMKMQAARP